MLIYWGMTGVDTEHTSLEEPSMPDQLRTDSGRNQALKTMSVWTLRILSLALSSHSSSRPCTWERNSKALR